MLFPNDGNSLTKKHDSEFKRLVVNYENKSEKFRFKTEGFSKQFAHIYAFRLNKMRKLFEKAIKDKWGNEYPVKELCDLREESPEKCILIGTIFKNQTLKPSILKEISEEAQLAPQPQRFNYTEDNDKLILEDELQRIRLMGKIEVHNVVTGIVCAVLGKNCYVNGDGKFMVDDFIYYESGPQKPLKTLSISPYLVLVSGLDQSTTNDFQLSLELFREFIFGNLDGFGPSRDWDAASIVRIIIAGNSVRSIPDIKQKSLLTRKPESTNILDAVKSCDKIFSNWSKSINIDLMPGEFDPSNYMLPQQPLHHCMLPECSKLSTFKCVTNPYECNIGDRKILGCSGQNIHDIMRSSKLDDPLEILKSTLIWSHIAPTSPDTLPCYPYINSDPFIIDECPHVYFVGNQNEFQTELYCKNDKKTRLVCVPSFCKTQSVAIINLNTLNCKKISFKINQIE